MDTGHRRVRRIAAGVAAVVAIALAVAATPGQEAPPPATIPTDPVTVHWSDAASATGHLGAGVVSQLGQGTVVAPTGNSAPTATTPLDGSQVAARFAENYLAYDYRHTTDEYEAAITPYATPDLVQAVIKPLPPTLVERLTAEERIVTVEVIAVLPVHSNPDGRHVVVSLTTSTHSGVGTEIRGIDLVLTTIDGRRLVGELR